MNRCTVSSETTAVGCAHAIGVVEDAAAADGGELVPVPDERDAGAGLVGDGEECAGGVLVEHPGLVDKQEVTRPE